MAEFVADKVVFMTHMQAVVQTWPGFEMDHDCETDLDHVCDAEVCLGFGYGSKNEVNAVLTQISAQSQSSPSSLHTAVISGAHCVIMEKLFLLSSFLFFTMFKIASLLVYIFAFN